jgi:hypothetical protein
MGAKKYPLRINVRKLAVDTTSEIIESDPVPSGELWCIQGHSYENETGTRGDARGYIEKIGGDIPIWDQAVPTLATLYWTDDVVFIREGERLSVRQATCTADDVMRLRGHGYKLLGSAGEVM